MPSHVWDMLSLPKKGKINTNNSFWNRFLRTKLCFSPQHNESSWALQKGWGRALSWPSQALSGDSAGTLQDTTNTCPAMAPPAAPSQLLSLKMDMENLLADGVKLIWHTLQRSCFTCLSGARNKVQFSAAFSSAFLPQWSDNVGQSQELLAKMPPEAAIIPPGFDGCFQYLISFPEVSADLTHQTLLSLWPLSFLSFFQGFCIP